MHICSARFWFTSFDICCAIAHRFTAQLQILLAKTWLTRPLCCWVQWWCCDTWVTITTRCASNALASKRSERDRFKTALLSFAEWLCKLLLCSRLTVLVVVYHWRSRWKVEVFGVYWRDLSQGRTAQVGWSSRDDVIGWLKDTFISILGVDRPS